MASLIALVAETANPRDRSVDARPLAAVGLITGTPAEFDLERLRSDLSEEGVYAALAHRLTTAVRDTARHLEHEVDLPFDGTVATLNDAIGGWHLALWRIFDSPFHLEACRASDVVLAPVTVTRADSPHRRRCNPGPTGHPGRDNRR